MQSINQPNAVSPMQSIHRPVGSLTINPSIMAPNTSNPLRQLLLELHEQALRARGLGLPSAFNEHLGYIDHEGVRYWKAQDKATGEIVYWKKVLPNGKRTSSTHSEFQSVRLSKSPQPTQPYFDSPKLSTAELPGQEVDITRKRSRDKGLALWAEYDSQVGSSVIYKKGDPLTPIDAQVISKEQYFQEIATKREEAIKDAQASMPQENIVADYKRHLQDDYSWSRFVRSIRSFESSNHAIEAIKYGLLLGEADDELTPTPVHFFNNTWKGWCKDVLEKKGIDSDSYLKQLKSFTGDSYKSIRKDKKKSRELSKGIEALLEAGAGFDQGATFRGISLSVAEFKKHIKVGKTVKQYGPSSWSSKLHEAHQFAVREFGQVAVVFYDNSTPKKSGVSIAAVSTVGPDEAEVLYPDSVRWKIKCIHPIALTTKDIDERPYPYIFVEVEEVK